MVNVLVSVFNNLYTDQRVEKVCRTLHENHYNILLIGNDWMGAPEMQRPYFFDRIVLNSKSLRLAYIEHNIKLYKLLLQKADAQTILLANDLDTLLPNFLVSKKLNIPLVFDSHEIYTEMPALQGRWTQNVWKLLEKKILPKLQWIMTESESYADWFSKEYNITKPVVIGNLPRKLKCDTSKNFSALKTILYQGTINPFRGIPETIQAMQFIDNAVFKIAGDGPKKHEYQKLVVELGLESKVQFLGPLHPDDLRKVTMKADVGISLEQNAGVSYYFSLPNKVGDYIQARVPVLMINFPEMKRIKDRYNVGEIIDNHQPENIATSLKQILEKGRGHYVEDLEAAAQVLCWENQQERLLKIFETASADLKVQ